MAVRHLSTCRWTANEADPQQVLRCKEWSQKHVAVDDIFVLPVTAQTWMRASWRKQNVRTCLETLLSQTLDRCVAFSLNSN